eukprot:GILJ01008444.1.p1 GENE.GILJ01008444.1~~GILJ01008444.1.p1  ORF type:complete len:256 (-),score=12.51 GILJ01008444.1:505-1272(-)
MLLLSQCGSPCDDWHHGDMLSRFYAGEVITFLHLFVPPDALLRTVVNVGYHLLMESPKYSVSTTIQTPGEKRQNARIDCSMTQLEEGIRTLIFCLLFLPPAITSRSSTKACASSLDLTKEQPVEPRPPLPSLPATVLHTQHGSLAPQSTPADVGPQRPILHAGEEAQIQSAVTMGSPFKQPQASEPAQQLQSPFAGRTSLPPARSTAVQVARGVESPGIPSDKVGDDWDWMGMDFPSPLNIADYGVFTSPAFTVL